MVNKVTLIGNLGADPELQYTSDGTAVVNISLATTERWKDADGNPKEKTEWHRLFMFGNAAEALAKYLKKGSKLHVEGTIRYQSYDDNEGNTKYITKIQIREFTFLDKLNDQEGTSKAAKGNTKAASRQTKASAGSRKTSPAKSSVGSGSEFGDDEELPF